MRALGAIVLALLIAAPALASASPPTTATRLDAGTYPVFRWVGPSETQANATTAASDVLWFAVSLANLSANATGARIDVNVTSGDLSFANGTGEMVANASDGYADLAFPFNVTTKGAGASYHFAIEVHELGNNTSALAGSTDGIGVLALTANAPGGPGVQPGVLVTVGVVLFVVLVAVWLAVRARRRRAAMNALDNRRSQALREEVLPPQEARQAEAVREQRRDLQILEAKRADALKTLDLLQKRHESGALSKHQFEQMSAKKRADLARIEAELAEAERT